MECVASEAQGSFEGLFLCGYFVFKVMLVVVGVIKVVVVVVVVVVLVLLMPLLVH